MKALITGVTGMVGSHLTDFLLKNTDWEIYGMCRWRSPSNHISHLASLVNSGERFFLEYADLRDTLSIQNVVKKVRPDYVFHLAAQSYPQTSFSAPLDTLDTNIQGTARVLESVREYCPGAVVHICASSEVFGRVSSDKLPIDEECSFHPASPYAISKVGTDLLSRYYAEAYSLCTVSTRMFTHTGPRRGDVFAESSFAKQIALIEADLVEPVIKVGNLESLRTIADVRDAVRAYYLLVTTDPEPGEYYNIGGNTTLTIGNILQDLISMSKFEGRITTEIDQARLRPIDADLQVPDTTKFKRKTGWEPIFSYSQTLEDLLNYWRVVVASGSADYIVR